MFGIACKSESKIDRRLPSRCPREVPECLERRFVVQVGLDESRGATPPADYARDVLPVAGIPPREPQDALDVPLAATVEQQVEGLSQHVPLALERLAQRLAVRVRRPPTDLGDPDRRLGVAGLLHPLPDQP